MTEGKVQKLFENFLAHNYFNSNKGLVVSVEQVMAFKQEVVKAIEKEIDETAYGCPYAFMKQGYAYTKKRLIGDNEE